MIVGWAGISSAVLHERQNKAYAKARREQAVAGLLSQPGVVGLAYLNRAILKVYEGTTRIPHVTN